MNTENLENVDSRRFLWKVTAIGLVVVIAVLLGVFFSTLWQEQAKTTAVTNTALCASALWGVGDEDPFQSKRLSLHNVTMEYNIVTREGPLKVDGSWTVVATLPLALAPTPAENEKLKKLLAGVYAIRVSGNHMSLRRRGNTLEEEFFQGPDSLARFADADCGGNNLDLSVYEDGDLKNMAADEFQLSTAAGRRSLVMPPRGRGQEGYYYKLAGFAQQPMTADRKISVDIALQDGRSYPGD
jgi:hypothetical protein